MAEETPSNKLSYEEQVELLRRAFSDTTGGPDDTESLSEYVPLPEADDEVVAVVIKKKPAGAKKASKSKTTPSKKSKSVSMKKRARRRVER